MLVGVELSENPCCIPVEKQRHSAVCIIGFEGFRRLNHNGFILLHAPTIHTSLLSTVDERTKVPNHCTLPRTIPVHVRHPYRMHTASHCAAI